VNYVARKREKASLGQKIVYIFFLSLGLIVFSFGALIHFSGGTNPRGLEYLIMMVGATFVIAIAAVIVISYLGSRLFTEEKA
jgi:putative flippase GtrA